MARLGPPPGPGGPFSRQGPHHGEDPARDKAMRSIFGELEWMFSFCHFISLSLSSVANIAFETTEEQLRSVLSEVGPVMSLKYVIMMNGGLQIFRMSASDVRYH